MSSLFWKAPAMVEALEMTEARRLVTRMAAFGGRSLCQCESVYVSWLCVWEGLVAG